MDPSVLGTAQIVFGKADSTTHVVRGRSPLPPGCSSGGCTTPALFGCLIQGGSVRVDPVARFMSLQWAPPKASPADLELVFTYKSDSSNSTDVGSNWSAPYHRFAEQITTINPPPISVNTTPYGYSYSGTSPNYTTQTPGNNSLVGSSTTGW